MLTMTFTLSEPPTAAENRLLDLAAQSLENAVDSGWSREWIRAEDYHWADKDNRADTLPAGREHDAHATFFEIDEAGERTGIVKTLHPIDFVQAWVTMSTTPGMINPKDAGRFGDALLNPGDADFDAIDDDAALQIALLGSYTYS